MKGTRKTSTRILSFVLSLIMVASTFMTDYTIARASEAVEETVTSETSSSDDVSETSDDTSEVEESSEAEESESTETTDVEEVAGNDAEVTDSEEVAGDDAEATGNEEVAEDNVETTEDEEVVEGEEELTEEELLEGEIVEIVEDIIKISFEASEGGSVSMSEQELGEEDEVEAVTATADEGYEFVNWTKDGEEVSASEEFTPAKEEATYVANFEEVEEEYPAQSFEDSASNGITVKAYVEEGVFPKNTKMVVTPVSKYVAMDAVKDAATEGKEIVDVQAVDITFVDENGNELQPADGKKVQVVLSSDKKVDGDSYAVVHVEDDGNAEQIAGASTDEAAFIADSFSIYALVGERKAPDRITFIFKNDDGSEIDSQIVKDGETLYEPAIPTSTKDAGDFIGWYKGVDEVAFDGFGEVSVDGTYEVELTARYGKSYNVYFYNQFDVVQTTKTVQNGSSIDTTDVTLAVGTTEALVGWTLTKGSDTVVKTVSVNGADVNLYPVIKTAAWITFDTDGGSYIEPAYVLYNEKTMKPANPEKYGYEFAGWYTSNTYNKQFAFGNTLSESITVYAKWNPKKVDYKVVTWLENANDEGYSFESIVTKQANAGSTTNVTASAKQGFTVVPVEQQVVKGDGTTIVNVIYNREVYKIEFQKYYNGKTVTEDVWVPDDYKYVGRGNGDWILEEEYFLFWVVDSEWVYVGDGRGDYQKIDGHYEEQVITKRGYYPIDELTIEAKYQENIAHLWPSRREGLSTTYPSNWSVEKDSSTMQAGIDVMPLGGEDFYFEEPSGRYTYELRYYVRDINNTKWELDHTDVIKGGEETYTTKEDYYPIEGFNCDRTASYKEGSYLSRGTRIANRHYAIGIYYNRNTYNITFNNGTDATSVTKKFEESIANVGYTPTRPANIPAGYEFAGWYDNKDGYGEAYDFTGKTMPANNLIFYAKWVAPTFEVSFDTAGGTGNADIQTVSLGAYAIQPTNPVKDGYTFAGWMKDGKPFNFATQITADTKLVASWIYNEKLTISYDAGEGSGAPADNKYYVEGSYAKVLRAPSTIPTGKVFLGWSVGGKTYYPNESYKVSSEDAINKVITLVAVYGAIPSTTGITYYANNKNNEQEAFNNIKNNSIIVLKSVEELGFENKNHVFIGWKDGDGNEYKAGESVVVDLIAKNTLTAQWSKKTYKLGVNPAGGTWNGVTNTQHFDMVTGETKEIPDPVREGFEFTGWKMRDWHTESELDEVLNGKVFTMGEKNTMLIAQWKELEYTVTLNKTTGIETVSGAGIYKYGDKVTISATVLPGYEWGNWTSGKTQTYTIDGITEDVTDTAYAKAIEYTISYDLAGGTVVGTNPTTYTVETADFTLNNPTKAGYTFAGWTGTELSGATENVTVAKGSTGDRTYTATWTPISYTITYDLAGGTVAGINPTSYTVETDTFTLINPTKAGYTFAGWTGTGLDEATTNVVITKGSTGERAYTATWTPISYTITYDLDGGTVTTANPTSYTVETDTFTLNNPTRTGYTFVGWTGTGLDKATEFVTVAKGSTGHRAYTATWTAIEYTVTYRLNGGSVDGKADDVVYNGLIYGQSYADYAPAPNVTKTDENGVTYFFDGWKAGENFVDLNGKTVTGNATYTAQWVEAQLIATGEDVTYDGAFHGIAVEKSNNVTITGYEVNGTTSANAPTYKNVSDNTITVKGSVTLSNGDVKAVTDTATVKISPRPITVQLASVTKSYSELMGRSITVDDIPTPRFSLIAGDGLASNDMFDIDNIKLAVEDGIDGVNKENGAITLASNSNIIIKSTGDDVSANYEVTVINGLAQVTDATKTVITLTANSGEFTYDATEKSVSGYVATINGNSLPEGYTVSNVSAEAKGTNAGEYNVTFSYDNGDFKVTDKNGKDVTKYFSIETVNGKLTIDKANLKITAKSAEKVYDGTELQGGYSVEGLQGTDSITSLQYKYRTGLFTNTSFVAPSITTPDTLNYSVQNVEISDGRTDNYNISYVDGTLKVTKADIAITVKANDNTATYDGSIHAAKWINGKQYSITSGKLLQGDYITDAYVMGGARDVSDEGTTTVYNVRIRHAEVDVTDCYNITKETGKVTINKRPITITVNSATKTYDGIELVAPVDESTGKAYKITEGSLADYYVGNYGFTQEIKEATVTGSILYPGEALSSIQDGTIKIRMKGNFGESFVDSLVDNVSDLIGKDLQSNYDITVVDGTLTITDPNPVALTITANGNSKVYDGTPLTAIVGTDGKAYTVSGELYPDHVLEATVSGTRTNAGGENAKESKIDSYTIMCGDKNVSEFYTVTEVASDLTVSQRPIMVVANDATKAVYDGIPFTTTDMLDEKGVGFKVWAVEGNADSGLLDGHTVTAEISVDENLTVSKESATHVANVAVADSDVMLLNEESLTDNYAIACVDGNAVVNADDKLGVTLTANSGTYTYTGGEFAVDGYTVTGPEGFDVTGLTFNNVTAGATATTVGSYTVSFAYADADGNELTEANVIITDVYGNDVTEYFTISYVNGNLVINARPSSGDGGGSSSGGGSGRSDSDVGRVLGARREDIATAGEEGQVLGAVRAPKTSDSSRAILWMLVMGTSALGAAAILAQKKNEEEN